MGQISDLVKESYEYAKSNGFHPETGDATFGDRIALIHSELSEALEEFRAGHAFDEVYYSSEKPGKPEGIGIELADAFIRIADLAGKHGIDLEGDILLKMQYNLTRPWRHGKKAL